jgi:hypothetical protein
MKTVLGLLIGFVLVACTKVETRSPAIEPTFKQAEKVAETPDGAIFEFKSRRGYCYVYEAEASSDAAISCVN